MSRPGDQVAVVMDEAQGRELYARLVEAQAERKGLHRGLAEVIRQHQTLMDTPLAGGSVDVRLEQLEQLENQRADAERRLTRARNTCVLLGEALHPFRLLGRARQVRALNDQVREVEERQQALEAERTEHLQAAEQLTELIGKASDRIADLMRQVNGAEAGARPLHLYVQSSDPFEPPAGVLVRPTAWQALIEKLLAAGFDTADVLVDETSGDLLISPVD